LFKDVEKAKEKHCYVAADYDQEIKDVTDGNKNKVVWLPDLTKVQLGKLQF
jgi:hypothetical protein